MRNLKSTGFATMSELNEIQNEQRRTTVVRNEDGEEEGDTFETDPNRRGSNESITLRGGSLGTSTVRARRVSVARGTCNLNDPNIQVRTTQCYRLSCIHLITK